MIKKILFLLIIWVWFAWISNASLVTEDCKTGKYSTYYPSDCKDWSKICKCGYYTGANTLYLWSGTTYYDYFLNIAHKEQIFSSRSTAKIEDFGNYLNEESLPIKTSKGSLSRLYSNWVPADLPDNTAVMFMITGVTLINHPVSNSIPVGRIEFYIRWANVNPLATNKKKIDPSKFPTGEFWYHKGKLVNNEFVIYDWVSGGSVPKYINVDSIYNHYQYYLLFPARCWDWEKNWPEECDFNDPSHNWWWTDGCSSDCKALNNSNNSWWWGWGGWWNWNNGWWNWNRW